MTSRGQAIAQADRTAFALVGGEQARAGKAFQRRGQLPAEVDGVADAGVHAVAAGRDVLVRRIAGQEYAATPVALGQQQMREPGIGDQDFRREGAAGPGLEHALGIEAGHVDLGRRPGLQGPGVLVVLGDQGAAGGLVVPGDAEGLQEIARVGAEMDHVAVRHRGAALQADAEPLAHEARAAVAAGEEVAAH